MTPTTKILILIVVLAVTSIDSRHAYAAGCTPGTNCIASGGTPPQIAPALNEPYSALSSGLFMFSKTDLSAGGLLPIELTRVYRSEDRDTNSNFIQRDFGLGQSFNYAIYLYSTAEVNGTSNPFANINVVMPDGSQLDCTCSVNGSCNGNSPSSTPLICGTTQPGIRTQPAGIWAGATLLYNPSSLVWNLTRKDASVYTFGKGAPLETLQDRYGNSITITRQFSSPNCMTQATRLASSSQRYIDLCYNSSGTVIKAIDSTGRYVTYGYNGNNALTSVTYSSYDSNATTQYVYGGSAQGDITKVNLNVSNSLQNPNTNYISYGGEHRVASLSPNISSNGYQYTYVLSRGTVQSVAVQIAADGTKETFFFDPHGYLTEVNRAPTQFGEVTCFNRNSSEDVAEAGDGADTTCTTFMRAACYSYSPNTLDDLTSITVSPPPGSTGNAATNCNGGALTTYTYQSVPLPDDNDIPFDELTSLTDPLQQKTTYEYDNGTPAIGNLTSITDPLGRTSNYTYYPNGLVHTAIDPKQNPPTTYTYYPSGDLETVTDPLNLPPTTFVTDGLGRVTQVTAPAGDVTKTTYNALDGVASVTDPNGNTTSYTYDLLGEIASVADPKGNATTYLRPNTLDKLTVTDPAQNKTVTQYDYSGKTTQSTDPRNVVTQISYDNLRRITEIAYDPYQLLGQQKAERAIYFNNYDALDRPATVTDTGDTGIPVNGGDSAANTINYTYDQWDNVLSENAASGASYTANRSFGYDAKARLQGLSATLNGATSNFGYCYDPDDELSNIYTSATVCKSGSLLASLVYDNDGNRQTLTVTPSGGSTVVTTYTPDDDNRLLAQSYTAGSNNLGSLNYGYDLDSRVNSVTGSLASTTLPPSTSSITYTTTNQINTWNGVSAQPDASSNMTVDPSTNASLQWDMRNQLFNASGGPASLYGIQYDSKGRRMIDQGANSGTNYYLDNKSTVVASQNVNGASTSYSYVTLPGGEVVSYSSGSATEVPIHDLAGSTIGLAGPSGTLQTQWSYEPFGAPTASGAASPFQFLFRGEQYDPTGYYGEYSPRLQRSLRGDVLPYMGQGADEFGRFPGYIPFKFHRTPTPWGRIGIDGGATLFLFSQGDQSTNGDGSSSFNGNWKTALGDIPFIDIFFAAFGGGASAPIFKPRYYKQSHSPACTFFGAALGLCADNSEPHYPTGLIDVVYNQSNSPSSSPTPGHIPGWNRPFPFYRYCGPLNYSPLSPNGPSDRCCQQHDRCYDQQGLSSGDVPLIRPGHGISNGQRACDEALCGCIGDLTPSGPEDWAVQAGSEYLFCP